MIGDDACAKNDDGDHIMVMSLIGDDACDENDGEITILSFNPSNESSLMKDQKCKSLNERTHSARETVEVNGLTFLLKYIIVLLVSCNHLNTNIYFILATHITKQILNYVKRIVPIIFHIVKYQQSRGHKSLHLQTTTKSLSSSELSFEES